MWRRRAQRGICTGRRLAGRTKSSSIARTGFVGIVEARNHLAQQFLRRVCCGPWTLSTIATMSIMHAPLAPLAACVTVAVVHLVVERNFAGALAHSQCFHTLSHALTLGYAAVSFFHFVWATWLFAPQLFANVWGGSLSVSYTHLTLPTNREV